MARIFVTGSSDGIGRETAQQLIAAGHHVVLHARTVARAGDARRALPKAAGVVVGDLSSLSQTQDLAHTAAHAGPFDAVIHNAGVGGQAADRTLTADGLEWIFQVNVVAPYLLTAIMPTPTRLVYLTSRLQSVGRAHLDDLQWAQRDWDGMQAYSDSKLYDLMLSLAVARLWPHVITNGVDPGWIRTRMGGPGATDELPEGAETQVWLASSSEPEALVSGRYLKHRVALAANPQARDVQLQSGLLAALDAITGVQLTS
jgi:NAD(P)-dependent dehydrogenase (short-subunit alcohol dehydrogenase family)